MLNSGFWGTAFFYSISYILTTAFLNFDTILKALKDEKIETQPHR